MNERLKRVHSPVLVANGPRRLATYATWSGNIQLALGFQKPALLLHVNCHSRQGSVTDREIQSPIRPGEWGEFVPAPSVEYGINNLSVQSNS